MSALKKYPYSFLAAWREDWRINRGNPKARLILSLFRFGNFFASKRYSNKLLYIAGIPYLVFYRVFVEWLLAVELPACTAVGPGLEIHHGQGLVVNGAAIIGDHCILRHNTTIGCVRNADGSQGPSPVLGAGVELGANVVVLGGFSIGNNAKVGAGSVVIREVAANSTVVGNPARVVCPK